MKPRATRWEPSKNHMGDEAVRSGAAGGFPYSFTAVPRPRDRRKLRAMRTASAN